MSGPPYDTRPRLFAEEALRGERLTCRMRWIYMGIALAVVALMIAFGRYVAAAWVGVVLLSSGLAYNTWLARLLRRGLLPTWVSYSSATIDILIITLYNYYASVYVAPLAVATAATFLLYPLVLFFIALRHSRSLLLYSIALTLAGTNLAYYLRYPYLDPALVAQIYSGDPVGMALRSLYLAMFGLSLLFLPRTINRLIDRQAALFQERQAAEERHRAELESQVAARTAELTKANQDLTQALEEVKHLSGLLPICTSCKKIRDDGGYWQGVEDYIRRHSQAEFTHAICPECMAKLYPDVYSQIKGRLAGLEPGGASDDPDPSKETP